MSEQSETTGGDEPEDMRSAEWHAQIQLAVDHMQLNALETQNPLYAWLALQSLLRAQQTPSSPEFIGDRVVLPSWIGRYLLDITQNICSLAYGLDIRVDPENQDKVDVDIRLAQTIDDFLNISEKYPPKTISAKDAAPLLGQALGLTRKSWSAFNAYASDKGDIETYHKVADLRDSGMTYEAACQHLADTAHAAKRDNTNDVADGRTVEKNVQRGAKLIAERYRRKGKTPSRQN